MGCLCKEEVSRKVIISEQKTDGTAVPWNNVVEFAEKCLIQMLLQLNKADCNQLIYFDRGIPDLIASLLYFNKPVEENYFQHVTKYSKIVFICPEWKEIYKQDMQRLQSFEESVGIGKKISEVYSNLGFEIIEIPKLPLRERAEFVVLESQKKIVIY